MSSAAVRVGELSKSIERFTLSHTSTWSPHGGHMEFGGVFLESLPEFWGFSGAPHKQVELHI